MTTEFLMNRVKHLTVSDFMLLCNVLNLNADQAGQLCALCVESSSQNSNCVK